MRRKRRRRRKLGRKHIVAGVIKTLVCEKKVKACFGKSTRRLASVFGDVEDL